MEHQDIVHDAQLDYYGKYLATCSSDRLVKIFKVETADDQNASNNNNNNNNGAERQIHVADLAGHEGPVWQVAWAHPKFGTLLASCSYDRSVIIWQQYDHDETMWKPVWKHREHSLSVNSIAWAPHEFGLMLACGSSDGTITIVEHRTDGSGESSWVSTRLGSVTGSHALAPPSSSSTSAAGGGANVSSEAHKIGINAVSWQPAVAAGTLLSADGSTAGGAGQALLTRRLVSGGCDNLVKIWTYTSGGGAGAAGTWESVELRRHADWVRDVAWAPNIGLPSNTIASCSEDGVVIIWTKSDDANASWEPTRLPLESTEPVWRLSWSVTGNILAVSSGDSSVSLWKEGVDGKFTCLANDVLQQ